MSISRPFVGVDTEPWAPGQSLDGIGMLDTHPASPPSTEALAPGIVLGDRYRLLGLAAQGGMGVVYQAWDQLREQRVAVKLLRDGLRQDPTARERFRDEAAAVLRVRHANVVAAFEFQTLDDGPAYLVLEWMDGGSVADLLRARGRLSPRQATAIVAEVCAALAAVHEAGLIHRDVKPANWLLSVAGQVKLADFGLAVALSAAVGPISGTPCYMSPEQARGEPLDPRADLYSLGVAYYELLTGVRPRQAGQGIEYAANAALPPGCAEIIRQATAPEPARRFTSAQAMLAAIHTVLCEVASPPPSPG
jgi:serine/threonine protein kinase